MSKYYQGNDVHEGKYREYLVRVCDYWQELKDKLFIKAYQVIGTGGVKFSAKTHFFIRNKFKYCEPRENIILVHSQVLMMKAL